MSDQPEWTDSLRERLRETLQTEVFGQLRLAKLSHAEVLAACRERIHDECPESEWDQFIHFVSEELNQITARLAAESATWPELTDCDRLDRVECALRREGILFWQASPCCDSCTWGELPDRIETIAERFPGFGERLRGYAFFIDQNLPDMLAEDTNVSVFLAYGWFSEDGEDVAADIYKEKSRGIAREVCQCLQDEGFGPDWDGDLARKIGISVNWQRRTQLE